MKLIYYNIFLLIFNLISYNPSNCTKSYLKFRNPKTSVLKTLNIYTSSLTLANLLRRLGSTTPILHLALRIQKRCKNNKLLKIWIKIIKHFKADINRMTTEPFFLKPYWSIYHDKRKKILNLFLKSFIKCGYVKGSIEAIGRIMKTYISYHHPFVLVSFVEIIKKIFYRRKIITTRKQNKTIYPFHLIKKLNRLRNMQIYCFTYKKECDSFNFNCDKKKAICDMIKTYRNTFIHKIRRVFIYFFSKIFNYVIMSTKPNKPFTKHLKSSKSAFFFNSPY